MAISTRNHTTASAGARRREAIGPVARAFHERIEIAVEQIVDDAARGAHGDRAQHEDHEHLGGRMRGAGDPHRPEHRPEQQPDADRAMQAREFDEIADAPRIAQRGQPRVRRRRREIEIGQELVSHWRASYTRRGRSAGAARSNSIGMSTCAGCATPFTSYGRNSEFRDGVARGAVEAFVTARAFDLDLRGAAERIDQHAQHARCRARACAGTRADTPARGARTYSTDSTIGGAAVEGVGEIAVVVGSGTVMASISIEMSVRQSAASTRRSAAAACTRGGVSSCGARRFDERGDDGHRDLA